MPLVVCVRTETEPAGAVVVLAIFLRPNSEFQNLAGQYSPIGPPDGKRPDSSIASKILSKKG